MINKESLKEGLDEMQIQTRNKIGNQCYFILFPSLLIDIFLGNCGVKWAASPVSISAIILISAIYYGIRVVGAGAYSTYNKKDSSIRFGFCALVIAIGFIVQSFLKGSFNISYSGALSLFIFLALFIMIIVVSSIISKRKNNEGND